MKERAARIKLLLLDVDGVMTDGRIIMNDRGEETKSFDVKDGLGLKMLMAAGIRVALVTGRESRTLSLRAKDLNISEVYQGVSDKRALCKRLMNDKGLRKQEICSMGDDLPDLAMFMESGLRIAVADAAREVREAADFITKNRGGYGAVREACEWLLKCQGKWTPGPPVSTGK
jgi:YrbI family 3-deoxy-D-manno-octulosonate 8-phosphate phosphatase